MFERSVIVSLVAAGVLLVPMGALAQSTPGAASAAHPAATGAPAAYDTFVVGAQVQSGLIPIVTKAGAPYLVLSAAQLGADFIESSVPSTGLGGFGPAAGEPYVAPARILRFERAGDKVVLRWPNTFAHVDSTTAQGLAARESLPNSVIAVVPIVAQGADGSVVISAAPFLGDIADYQASFDQLITNPAHGYHMDPTRSFFTSTKAFPDNDVLHVSQTFASAAPNTIDNAPDPRSIEVGMTYNIVAAPKDGYVPRIADPRVGYFEQSVLDFQHDLATPRNVNYVTRWNFAPEHPGQPSNATRPLVFYLANDIPVQYRDTVRAALLTWNDAFAKVGILNAVQVLQQPDDPSWDPEDVRHNMVRWIDTTSPQYGAEALLIDDPRSGEEINVGVNVDAIEGSALRYFHYVVAPARDLPDTKANEDAFEQAYLRSVVLHESGHDLGLQHNFIGSMAYTAKDLQSRAFTDKYGVATSVMEYAPINLWPKGTPQGDYVQLVLGPYDYYAIHYGYASVPGATTARAELPTLRRWADRWSNPTYRFASDEDAFFNDGHAIDPRVQQDDLTNHPLAWCQVEVTMFHNEMNAIDRWFPQRGDSYADARRAFVVQASQYVRCATMAAHVIGGEYLSRADAGDPGSTVPLTAVPRSQDVRAWHQLATNVFSDAAWAFNPNVLRRMTYSEVSSLTSGGTWAYNPTPRHDISPAALAAAAQESVLNEIFNPLTLARIDDLSTKYAKGTTMSLTDLFDWSDATILGDIANGHVAADGIVRRNLQTRYAQRLAGLWLKPAAGTPSDASAFARQSLVRLRSDVDAALLHKGLDEQTRAHLDALSAIATQALQARAAIE
jgi:hypothetical protein